MAGKTAQPVRRYDNQSLKYVTIEWLQSRGITLQQIGDLVYSIQKQYIPDLSAAECLESVDRVLDKREVQNAVFTGLTLDELAEKGQVKEPLLTTLRRDDGLYGVDEVLALSIVNVYGSIGLTNFGYLDKVKPGIIGVLQNDPGHVNTFLDDLVAALAAAAAARVAHQARDAEEASPAKPG